jgi:hypothetical protein
MAKIDVELTAVMHTDKGLLQPGETVSMEEGRAGKLAALGMVKLPVKAERKRAKNGKPVAGDPVMPGGISEESAGGASAHPDGQIPDDAGAA